MSGYSEAPSALDLRQAMSVFETSSPFAEQPLKINGVDFLLGELFEHYQDVITPAEKACLFARCLGYTWAQIALRCGVSTDHIKQLERRAIAHMVLLYRQGK